MIPGFRILDKELCQQITEELDKVGILYRIFSRIKDEKSINEKIERKGKEGVFYTPEGRLIQDLIGIRIITYFKDDIELVKEIINCKIDFVDEEIDDHDLTVFKPKRTNIICSLTEGQSQTLKEVQKVNSKRNFHLLDSTFELQLRTILSEGWHEVDHNLRYKCKSDWENQKENERLLNGIYASLETNDLALKNLFNELAYQHFKNKNWEGLLRNKFRLKFQQIPLNMELRSILDSNSPITKEIFKIDRHVLLMDIYKLNVSLPISFNTIVYLINYLYLKDKSIMELTPEPILDLLNNN